MTIVKKGTRKCEGDMKMATEKNIWKEFDESFDPAELQKEIEKAADNTYDEVPVGTYRVGVEKMELTKSKSGNPMVSIWFDIKEGKFKKSKIFYNQVINNGFGIHNNNEFLKSMDLDCILDLEDAGKNIFQTYPQYGQLLLDAAEEIDEVGLTFDLEYSEGKNGYHNYKIKDVFEN